MNRVGVVARTREIDGMVSRETHYISSAASASTSTTASPASEEPCAFTGAWRMQTGCGSGRGRLPRARGLQQTVPATPPGGVMRTMPEGCLHAFVLVSMTGGCCWSPDGVIVR